MSANGAARGAGAIRCSPARCSQHVAYLPEQAEPAHARLLIHGLRELRQRIQDRAQRLGRRDAVTTAAPDRWPIGGLAQRGGKRRLADAGFPAEEHAPPAAFGRLAKQPLLRSQEARPLNQHNRY